MIDNSPDAVDEEPEAEHPEDDRGDPGEIVDGDADQADQGSLARVLAQVQGSQNPEGDYREGHDHDHHHGAEQRREYAPLGVRLARLAAEELPRLAGVEGCFAGGSHLVGQVEPDNVGEPYPARLARRKGDEDFVFIRLAAQVGQTRGQDFVLLPEHLPARGEPFQPRSGPVLELQLALIQPDLLDLRVDRGDFVPFQPPDPFPQGLDAGAGGGELLPGKRGVERGRFPSVNGEGGGNPEHVPPLDPLQDGRFGGEGCGDDFRFGDPAEIQPVHIAVTRLDLEAPGRCGPCILCGYLLAPQDLAEDGGAVGQLEPGDVPGPEESQAVYGDDCNEPGDDQQAEGQGASREPDEGVAAAQEGFHTRLYLSRRRWRTPSAAVLSRKVTANSRRPLRNSTR